MNYKVIFDITQTEFQQWTALYFGIAGIILAAGFLLYQGRLRWKFSNKVFAMVFPCYLSAFSLLGFFHSYQNYLHVRSAMQQSQCEVTEGIVTKFFQPLGDHNRTGEEFVVDGKQFRYQPDSAQNGFHQIGIIHNGMQVRIYHYDKIDPVGKDIARLEIAQ